MRRWWSYFDDHEHKFIICRWKTGTTCSNDLRTVNVNEKEAVAVNANSGKYLRIDWMT